MKITRRTCTVPVGRPRSGMRMPRPWRMRRACRRRWLAKTATLAQSLSEWPNASAAYFQGVQERLKGFASSWEHGPFANGYWGHPAYLLPHRSPEKKKEVWEDMKFLLAQMGRAIEKK